MASASASVSENCYGRGKAPKPKDLTADDVTETYRSIAAHATLVSGTIAGDPIATQHCQQSVRNIRTVWSQRDIDCKQKTRFVSTDTVLTVTSDNEKLRHFGHSPPQYITHLWDVESPSLKRRVVILKRKDKKGEEKQYIEIWCSKCKKKTIDVSALDKHGDVVEKDGQFGSVQWSACEEYLLYVAEKKKPKTVSFFETKSTNDDKAKGDEADRTIKGGEYLHQECWGEQLVERRHTVVCRLNVNTGVVTLLTHVPDVFSPGQAIWGPDNEAVFVVWCQEPFRLGLRFCVERKSFICKAKFEAEDDDDFEILSEEGRAVRCPSFSPDKSRLVYLDTTEGGAHNKCSRLMMIDWKKWAVAEKKKEAREVIVDIVSSPNKTGYDAAKDEFPGLYTWADVEAKRMWLEDGVHILLTSFWRSSSTILIINTNTKSVRALFPYDKFPFRTHPSMPAHRSTINIVKSSPGKVHPAETTEMSDINDGFDWSCTLLDVQGNDVLISCSWPDKPTFIVFGHLEPDGSKECQWIQLGCQEEDSPFEQLYNWQVFVLDPRTIQAAHPAYDYLGFESILYLPAKDRNDDTKPPLVVFPHGGPHSVFDSSFVLNPALFACCGFAVLCVNFRGSLGFGQDSIDCLLGHVGDLDVKDCFLAMKIVQDADLVDPQNTFVYGGSHGGFLSAHLVGQYPNLFRAASMRNPVTNLTSMASTSDISDWVFTEAGLHFDYKSLAKGDLLNKLWKASPVSYIDNVKTPVMLHIGLKDLRVPHSQGLEYCKMLKARDVPVQCHVYPESNHSLSEVEIEADSLINSILWFSKHIHSTDN